ncbi:MAG: TldD/PmbA family protein [Thermoplasmata archaeon]|nr:TldD/PmbA family protein [Thermoplasmata archaeon]
MGQLLSIADTAVNKGLKLGADEIEILLLRGESTEVALENNDIHIGRTDVRSGTGIRVFKKKGLGFASTNSVNEKDIVNAIERALQLAGHAPSEPWNELPDKAPLKDVDGLYDPESESFETEDALQMATEMLNTAKDFDERITVDKGTFSAHRGEEAIANSRGVQAEEKTSSFLWFIMGMAIEGEEVSNLDYSIRFTHNVRKIDVGKVAEEFAERVTSSLGAKSVGSFEGPVILGPDAGKLLLGTVLTHAINSDNVQKGMSQFGEKIGEEVCSTNLSVMDDGLLEDGLATSSFDREGLPHQRIGLIENGILKSYIYNTKTASKDSVRSTGNASGDERQSPGVGTTNVVIEDGKKRFEDIVGETEHGLIVRRLSGYPDPLSGDFSAVVKGGFLVKNGDMVQPVTDTMISGNVFDLLRRIDAVSKERERVMSFTLPSIKVEGVSVTGKG